MQELLFHRLLLPAVERNAAKVAFFDGAYEGTYAQHLDRVCRVASVLHDDLGISRGDRFAVMALNSHHFLELYHAAFLGVGVVNPLNLRLATKELAYILADSETKVCFVDAPFAGLINAVRDEVGLEHVVLIGDGDVEHDAKLEDLMAGADSGVPPEPEETDPVVLMYTGGTTGLPKGVLLEHRAEMLNLYHIAIGVGLGEDYVFLHQTPMFHAASMGGILGIPGSGGTSVFVPMFNPPEVLDAMERHGVTMTVVVPTMLAMLLDTPGFRPEQMAGLTRLVYGASPMPTTLLERTLEMLPNVEVFQGYGMTEGSSVSTLLGPEEHRGGGALLRSAGRPVIGTVMSIQDPDGTILPVGETGEVCFRGGQYMREYWKKPEATEEAFRGGWYHTGDAGYADPKGYLYLVDRVKDMIVSGGENVYSVEVENAIATHPAVAQVAVIGVPNETWGEAVHAIVVLRDEMTASEEEIVEHARRSIAGYKVPKSVEFRDEPLPLSGAMKVLKRDLRAPYWAGRERGVN